MTLAEVDALLERHQEQERGLWLRAGLIAATIWNANPFGEKNRKPISPMDYLPDHLRTDQQRRDRQPRGQQTLDEQVAVLTSILGCGPGKPGNGR